MRHNGGRMVYRPRPTDAQLIAGGLGLGQLGDDDLTLRLFCNRCARLEARVSPYLVLILLGRDAPVYGAWRYFHCGQCGARGSLGDLHAMPEQAAGSARLDTPMDAWQAAVRRASRPGKK